MDPDQVLEALLSCGKPRPGMDVILLDGYKERITTAGVPGKIFAKDLDITGVHKPQEKTAESRVGIHFSVGVSVYFDEDGHLHINERRTDGDGEPVDGPDSNTSTADDF